MKPIHAVAALALTLGAAGTAAAGETVLTKPIEAGSLHDGRLDMIAFYQAVEAGYEVTATFAPKGDAAAPMRVVMLLAEGDRAAFTLPGHPGTLYRFARQDGSVTVSATGDHILRVAATE